MNYYDKNQCDRNRSVFHWFLYEIKTPSNRWIRVYIWVTHAKYVYILFTLSIVILSTNSYEFPSFFEYFFLSVFLCKQFSLFGFALCTMGIWPHYYWFVTQVLVFFRSVPFTRFAERNWLNTPLYRFTIENHEKKTTVTLEYTIQIVYVSTSKYSFVKNKLDIIKIAVNLFPINFFHDISTEKENIRQTLVDYLAV